MSKQSPQQKFKEIDESVKDDPKAIINTLLHYFGGADALWDAVHTHITDFVEMDEGQDVHEEDVEHLEQCYQRAIDDIVEQEFLVNDN